MAISYVSSNSADAATVTVSSVQVGDLIVVLAMSTIVLPALPAGWTSLATDDRVRVGYKVATTAGSQSVGTWTDAQYVAVGVWRGAKAPGKGAISVYGTPALSGLATDAWIGALTAGGVPGPAVVGLTERYPDAVYDSAGPMASRAATIGAAILFGALVEIPPGTQTWPMSATSTATSTLGPGTITATGPVAGVQIDAVSAVVAGDLVRVAPIAPVAIDAASALDVGAITILVGLDAVTIAATSSMVAEMDVAGGMSVTITAVSTMDVGTVTAVGPVDAVTITATSTLDPGVITATGPIDETLIVAVSSVVVEMTGLRGLGPVTSTATSTLDPGVITATGPIDDVAIDAVSSVAVDPLTARGPIGDTTITATSSMAAEMTGLKPITEVTITATSTMVASMGMVTGITLHRLPRSIDQLITTGSAPRHDHVLITTGTHAGARLPVISCSLTLDETADVRATGTLHVAAEPWVRDLLDPRARTELAIITALEDDEGERHTWQLALVHPVSRPHALSATAAPTLSVQVADRAHWVKAAGMRDRRVVPAGVDIATAIAQLLASRAPWLPLQIPPSGYTFGVDAVLGELGADPWTIAADLARSLGRILYIDQDGTACTSPVTATLAAPPVAEWIEGSKQLSALSVDISDDDVVNVLGCAWRAIPADGQDDADVPGGIEYWEDRSSSVRIEVLGERVRDYGGDVSVITSAAQARTVAESAGLTLQGIAIQLAAPGVRWDPRRELGDIIHIRRPELGIDLVTRLTGLGITLGAMQMDATLAERRIL